MVEALTTAELCVSCGSPHAAEQEYCLECGARLHSSTPRSRLHWLWPSLLALAVAGTGAAVAIASSGNAVHSQVRTVVATQKLAVVPPAQKAQPQAPVEPKQSRSPLPTRTGALVTWPGGDRYTIVLSSFPARSGLLAAKARAEEAARAGFHDVGVLVSSSYSSLHPGYYVVFSGIYETLEQAQSELPQVTPRFPSAHAQRVAR
jgi:hypothetical protein